MRARILLWFYSTYTITNQIEECKNILLSFVQMKQFQNWKKCIWIIIVLEWNLFIGQCYALFFVIKIMRNWIKIVWNWLLTSWLNDNLIKFYPFIYVLLLSENNAMNKSKNKLLNIKILEAIETGNLNLINTFIQQKGNVDTKDK